MTVSSEPSKIHTAAVPWGAVGKVIRFSSLNQTAVCSAEGDLYWVLFHVKGGLVWQLSKWTLLRRPRCPPCCTGGSQDTQPGVSRLWLCCFQCTASSRPQTLLGSCYSSAEFTCSSLDVHLRQPWICCFEPPLCGVK